MNKEWKPEDSLLAKPLWVIMSVCFGASVLFCVSFVALLVLIKYVTERF